VSLLRPIHSRGKREKNTATSNPRRKKNTKKRLKKDPSKLPYHMNDEGIAAIVAAEVKSHFATKKAPPKEVLDP
jgi:hypothetical protein